MGLKWRRSKALRGGFFIRSLHKIFLFGVRKWKVKKHKLLKNEHGTLHSNEKRKVFGKTLQTFISILSPLATFFFREWIIGTFGMSLTSPLTRLQEFISAVLTCASQEPIFFRILFQSNPSMSRQTGVFI